MKQKIREVIVVEGRYDKNTLLQVVDATVVETGGFGVFNDKEKLAFLNQCTHKYITAEVNRQIAAAKEEGSAKAIIVDAPLLLEAGLEKVCDLVWVVYADPEVRAQRVMARDGVSYELAKARIANQKSWEEYKAAASTVIDNSKDLAFLEDQLAELLKKL